MIHYFSKTQQSERTDVPRVEIVVRARAFYLLYLSLNATNFFSVFPFENCHKH